MSKYSSGPLKKKRAERASRRLGPGGVPVPTPTLAAEELGGLCGEAGSFNVIHPITGSCRRQNDIGSLEVGSLDLVTR